MTKEVVYVDILINLEDAQEGIFHVNLIYDSLIILRMIIKYGDHYSKLEKISTPKNSFLKFIINNYQIEIRNFLIEIFQLLKDSPHYFHWEDTDKSWIYLKELTATDLLSWNKYSSEKLTTDESVWDKYTKLDFIGQGTYSKVYRVVENSPHDGQENTYIMKQIRREFLSDDAIENITREINILKTIITSATSKASYSVLQNSGFFPEYVEDFSDNQFIYIVTEHKGDYIDLETFINEMPIEDSDLYIIFINLIQGLKILHDFGVIHKDIKPKNILINPKNLYIQYIDFGLSCWSTEIECFNKCKGTPLYIAPEIYYRLSRKSPGEFYPVEIVKSSDVWALGLVFHMLIQGSHPLSYINSQKDLTKYLSKMYLNQEQLSLTEIPDNFKPVLESMLIADPEERATLLEIEKIILSHI